MGLEKILDSTFELNREKESSSPEKFPCCAKIEKLLEVPSILEPLLEKSTENLDS